MKKKLIAAVLSLVLLLTACGKGGGAASEPERERDGGRENTASQAVTIAEPKTPQETELGYKSTVIEPPDWAEEFGSGAVMGDVFYILAETGEGAQAVAAYDTIAEQWQRYELDMSPVYFARVQKFSAAGGALWILLREGYGPEDTELYQDKYYWLLHYDLETGEQSCNKLEFWQEGEPYLFALIALDGERVLLGDGESSFLIDSRGQLLEETEPLTMGEGFNARIGDSLYVNTPEGLAPLDTQSLEYGPALVDIRDRAVYSSPGDILTVHEEKLCRYDPVSGTMEALFAWTDVALSYSYMYGWTGMENSKGDIYHLTDSLIKVSLEQIPKKDSLVLACFGDSSDDSTVNPFTSYVCTDALKDAIIRFNNSDPEYRIEIRPVVYNSEEERELMLIELINSEDIDLIDTSLLPEGAVDDGLLVDLLPYIDADPNLSREDFIPSLLEAMMRDGGLYEYTDKFTLLTMTAPAGLLPEGEGWTAEKILELSNENPELLFPMSGDELLQCFMWAATAEFIDRDAGKCSFDTGAFASWLELLKTVYERDTGEYRGERPFSVWNDFASDAGHSVQSSHGGAYAPLGFPDAGGSGSYFIELARPALNGGLGYYEPELKLRSSGMNTSLGIMASGEKLDGAWRFMSSFMAGENEPYIYDGIPVRKDSFEKALENQLERSLENKLEQNLPYDIFGEQDAEYLRQLVYSTDRMVINDPALLELMKREINAFLGGKYSAQDCASQIQSRVSLYLAEQS